MSALDEYVQRGGMVGVANECLVDELSKAALNPLHDLRPVIDAFSKCSNLKAVRLLVEDLKKALSDSSHVLHLTAYVYLRLPGAHLQIEHMFKYLEARGWKGPDEKSDMEDVYNQFIQARSDDRIAAIKVGNSLGGRVSADRRRSETEARDSEIRASHLSTAEIAERYGISQRRVRQIVNSK